MTTVAATATAPARFKHRNIMTISSVIASLDRIFSIIKGSATVQRDPVYTRRDETPPEGVVEKSGKRLNMPDIVVLRLVAEGPDCHFRDHAAAKIADRLVAH
jgi:hypothetical protein